MKVLMVLTILVWGNLFEERGNAPAWHIKREILSPAMRLMGKYF